MSWCGHMLFRLSFCSSFTSAPNRRPEGGMRIQSPSDRIHAILEKRSRPAPAQPLIRTHVREEGRSQATPACSHAGQGFTAAMYTNFSFARTDNYLVPSRLEKASRQKYSL